MSPRRKRGGIEHLIGKTIRMESKYDDVPLVGTLVSMDNDYLGVAREGRVWYFSKQVIRLLTEVTSEPG